MGLFKSLTQIIFGNKKIKYSDQNSGVSTSFNTYSGTPKKSWEENQDIITGLEFVATMQLRTPLRVLKRHGEIHSDINAEPEPIAKERWEGIWIPALKSWRELGLDIDNPPESTLATDIGQIKATDYLPFLKSVREIVEKNESIDIRINMLRDKTMTGNWKN